MAMSKSVIPRLRSASCQRGSLRTTSSTVRNSSSMIEAWTFLISSQRTTFSWVRETTASIVFRFGRSRRTTNAWRSTWVPLPGFQASTSFLAGSFSITYTNRWSASRPRSFLRIDEAAWTSSAVSGSSGCLVVTTAGFYGLHEYLQIGGLPWKTIS